jgi:hypothetical protein
MVRQIGHWLFAIGVELTPDERRGIIELNGEGEDVSGIALQRSEKCARGPPVLKFGEDALDGIESADYLGSCRAWRRSSG